MTSTVVENRDVCKMGQVLSEDGTWLFPLTTSRSGMYIVPQVGETVQRIDNYYLAQEADYGDKV